MAAKQYRRLFLEIIFPLYLLAGSASAQSSQCWYPDQKTLAPDVPCNSNGSVSACCGAESFCVGNGLCYVNGVISRGSCTDQTWQSPECAQYCTTSTMSSGVTILNCDVTTQAFICAGNDCATQSFTMRDANSFVFNGSDGAMTTAEPYAILDQGSTSSGGSSATPSREPSTTDTTSSNAKYTAGDMAGVGAGVGVPLLLALLGALFVIWRQKKRLSAADRAYSVPGEGTDYYGDNKLQVLGSQLYPPQAYSQGAYQPVGSQEFGHRMEMDTAVHQVNEMASGLEAQELDSEQRK